MAGGNSHQRAVELAKRDKAVAKKEGSTTSKPAQPEATAQVQKRPLVEKKTPDLGTKIGFVGAAMAVILFLEEKSFWSVVLLLIALFLISVPIVAWSIADLFNTSKKRTWMAAVPLTLILVGIYGWHALPDASYSPSHLRQLSVKELKDSEKRLAAHMRDFQDQHNKRMVQAVSHASEKSGFEYAKEDVKFRTEFFQTGLQSRISSMRSELCLPSGKG
jgi:hypothetical protein